MTYYINSKFVIRIVIDYKVFIVYYNFISISQ
jgi:hypothetical protein